MHLLKSFIVIVSVSDIAKIMIGCCIISAAISLSLRCLDSRAAEEDVSDDERTYILKKSINQM